MNLCIYGAGAMGTSLGELLIKVAPCDLVTRNRAWVGALKERGFSALLPEEMTKVYDVVFLAAKQRENGEIARFLEAYLAEDGALVTVQNGLPEAGLAEILGARRVYGAALSWGAEKGENGKVTVTSECGFRAALGAYGGGERLGGIAQLMRAAGISVAVEDLTELRFAKIATNASFSTLSAISGLPFGVLARKYPSHVLALMREVFAVARAYGCKKLPLNGHDLYAVFGAFGRLTMPFAMHAYRNTRSGMLLDLEAGRRCDVDLVAGAVVAAGKEKGVACPRLARAVALVHDIENGLAELAPESLDLLKG